MLIASLSLVGFPFLSGFYSKDFLLEETFILFKEYTFPIIFISALSTAISSFYSFRLIYFVFLAEPSYSKKILKNIAEGSRFLYFPLIILSLFSIFSGYFFRDFVYHSVLLPFFTSLFPIALLILNSLMIFSNCFLPFFPYLVFSLFIFFMEGINLNLTLL